MDTTGAPVGAGTARSAPRGRRGAALTCPPGRALRRLLGGPRGGQDAGGGEARTAWGRPHAHGARPGAAPTDTAPTESARDRQGPRAALQSLQNGGGGGAHAREGRGPRGRACCQGAASGAGQVARRGGTACSQGRANASAVGAASARASPLCVRLSVPAGPTRSGTARLQ